MRLVRFLSMWILLCALAGCSLLPGCGAKGTPRTSAEPGEPRIHAEALAYSLAAIGWPGAKRAFQIGHGSVIYAGDAAMRFTIPDARETTSPVYFERDGVPIAHWLMEGGGVRVAFEAAGVPHEALADTNLLLSVRVTLTRLEAGTGEAAVELQLRGTPEGPHAVPWDASDEVVFKEWWHDHGAYRNDRLVAALDPSASITAGAPSRGRPGVTEGLGPGTLAARLKATLARGASRSWQITMPAYPVDLPAGRLLKRDHDDIAARARGAWRAWLAEAARPVTPDTLVNAAWDAALVTLIQCQERFDGDWVSIGSPFQYRDVWVRDGARVVRALAVSGLAERARANAWTFRRFQLPSGAFLSQRGQLDGTGQAMWAMQQAASIPPDAATARKFLPYAARGFRWIEQQRGATRALNMRWSGLLPYADPRDAELIRAQLTGNDAWAIAGLEALVLLARRAGDDALAHQAWEAREDYRRTFERALAATSREDVPPAWQPTGRDWGNLQVGYPTRALPLDNVRLLLTARRVWGEAPGTALATYGPPDSLHGYLGADLAQWALLTGRPSVARAYVRDLLSHSSSTLGQCEIFHRRTGGFGTNLPPHTTAAATLMDLLRNMIVTDERDTLDLALCGDLAWWDGTRFERAPTRFGVIDVHLTRPAKDELHASWGAATAPVRIRVPDGVTALESLTPGAHVEGGRWLHAAPGLTRAAFRIREDG